MTNAKNLKRLFLLCYCYMLIVNNLGNTEKYKEESKKKIAQYFHCSEMAIVNIRWTLIFAYVQVEVQINSFIEMSLYSICWWKYLIFLEHNKEKGKESLALGKYLTAICIISCRGEPGWLSSLSVWLQLTSWSVCGFEPHIGLCADSSEPGACLGFSVSLSLPLPRSLTLTLSLKSK